MKKWYWRTPWALVGSNGSNMRKIGWPTERLYSIKLNLYHDNYGVNTVITYMGIIALAEQSKTFPTSRLDSLVVIVSEFHETRTLRPRVGPAVEVTADNTWEQLHDKHCGSALTHLETILDASTTSLLSMRRQQQLGSHRPTCSRTLRLGITNSYYQTIMELQMILNISGETNLKRQEKGEGLTEYGVPSIGYLGRLDVNCGRWSKATTDFKRLMRPITNSTNKRLGIRGEYEWYTSRSWCWNTRYRPG